jgi:tellurite methyltransferase
LKQFNWPEFYKHTSGRPPWERLVRAVSYVFRRADALDLGCGAGRDTLYLLEQGFEVTAVDADAQAMAILATFPHQERLHAVQSSFADFVFAPTGYDIINAHFALPFAGKAGFDIVFERVKRALRPGGIFVGQIFGVNDQWNRPEQDTIAFHTRAEAEELLRGFELIEFEEEDVDSHTADGSPKHWHVFNIIARKPSIS